MITIILICTIQRSCDCCVCIKNKPQPCNNNVVAISDGRCVWWMSALHSLRIWGDLIFDQVVWVMSGFTTMLTEGGCQLSLSVNISICSLPHNLMKGRDWSSHFENVNLCLFCNKSYLMTQNENILSCLGNDMDSLWFEISLISCQIWYMVEIETTIHFLLPCQGLIPFRGDMNISHSSVWFHILNCLSVIGG